jgi:hypothetical protein
MLEELALAVVFGIVGHTAGVVSDIGMRNLINFSHIIKKDRQYINHDLENGLNHAYLLAVMNICNECKSGLIARDEEKSEEFNWLGEKQRQLATNLQSIEEKKEKGDFSLSMKEMETLLISDNMSTSQYFTGIQEQVISFTLLGDVKSPCFKEKVKSSLLDELSLYFAFEIKNNPRLRNIFQSQILSQVDLHVEDIEISIHEISKRYPDLQTKLDVIQNELSETRTQLDSHHREIVGVLTSNVADISEIKTHLRILTQQLNDTSSQKDEGYEYDALIFIKKGAIPPKKKIPLRNDQNIFILGRKNKDTNPDIPFDNGFISKKHASIERKDEAFYLMDISKNGTNINGIPLEKEKSYKLTHGDQIGLANDQAICYFCNPSTSSETMELP